MALPQSKTSTLAFTPAKSSGVAGVSGNGQRELVEALIGQREPVDRDHRSRRRTVWRDAKRDPPPWRVFSLPEEPLKNACVGRMSVRRKHGAARTSIGAARRGGFGSNRAAMQQQAESLIAKFGVKSQGPNAPIATLSGGNVQRAVLARELAADRCRADSGQSRLRSGFRRSGGIHARILAARDAGAAVLLVSEDLDELLELADRIVVMREGRHWSMKPRRSRGSRTVLGQSYGRPRHTPMRPKRPSKNSGKPLDDID